MNLRQIRYFVAVAETLHFGRAAEKLHISQPPLSMSIQQLERRLNLTLFKRDHKIVTLTNAGKAFYQESLLLLKQSNNMINLAHDLAQGIKGRITIAFIGSMMFRGLPQIIKTYQHHYPEVEIIFKELATQQQIEHMLIGAIDLGMINTIGFPRVLHSAPHIAFKLMEQENFVCCLAKNHSLSKARQISLCQLVNENFIVFPRSISQYYYDRVLLLCLNEGFSPTIKHEVQNWRTIIELVALNVGVALVPQPLAQGIDTQHLDVIYRPLKVQSAISEIYCMWNKNNYGAPLENFITALTEKPIGLI